MKETIHQFTLENKKMKKMFPFSRYLVSFMLLVSLVGLCDGGAGIIQKKVDLRMTNDLGTGENINVHCKSKDDDLGAHLLTPGQYFEFRFRPNFWGTTLFFCRFWWGNESHWFDIYDQNRDTTRCDSKCWWMVGPIGPCLLDHNFGIYDLCQNWNDDKYNDAKYLEGSEN